MRISLDLEGFLWSYSYEEGANNFMITIAGGPAWLTVGWLIALLVLVVDIVFLAIGQMDIRLGALIGGLALARML